VAPPSDTLTIAHDENEKDGGEIEVKPGEIRIDKYGNIISSDQVKANALAIKAQAQHPLQSGALAALSPMPAPPAAPQPPMAPVTQPVPAPAPTPPPVAQVPPMVAPEPPPAASPPPQAASATPPSVTEVKASAPESEIAAEPPHALLDPADHQHSPGPAFSADTQLGFGDSDSTRPVDPLSDSHRPDGFLLGRERTVEPSSTVGLSSSTFVYPEPDTSGTPTFPTPTVNDARSAVQHAVAAAPYDPSYEGPVAALNAAPLSNDLARPAPPPVPPPLPLRPDAQQSR
jgi:flagellar protein FliO/FliZ